MQRMNTVHAVTQARPALPLLARLLARREPDVVAAAARALASVAKAGCLERVQV